jgi:hypothetical protein
VRRKLSFAAKFDLIRGIILFSGFLVLNSLDSSRIYHWIRAQSVLKLYVIFNILEVPFLSDNGRVTIQLSDALICADL